MTQPISLRELQEAFLNLEIPEQDLADYVEIRADQSGPFAPALTPRADNVDLTPPLGGPAVRAELLGDVVNRLAKERRRRQFERDLERRPALPTIYAEGDSWFQFPVFIEELIDHLRSDFNILCTSAAGDTLRRMVFERPEYLQQLKRLIFLRGLDVRGFFFSGAGNDVIGEGEDGVPCPGDSRAPLRCRPVRGLASGHSPMPGTTRVHRVRVPAAVRECGAGVPSPGLSRAADLHPRV